MTWDRASQGSTCGRPGRRPRSPGRWRHGHRSCATGRPTKCAVAPQARGTTGRAVVLLAAAALVVGAVHWTPTAAASSRNSEQLRLTAVRASSHRAGHAAALLTDGRNGTRWVAANCAYPQWVRVDLGKMCSVGGLKIAWYQTASRTYTYAVQVSGNASSWRAFTPGVRARYVRLRILRCSAKRNPASIRELTVLRPVASVPNGLASPVAPATQTIRHLVISSGTHDKTYDNVTFTGGGSGNPNSSGVIEISGDVHNITFVNCTIEPNADGVGNGVKIVDSGGSVHDVTFRNCHFMSQPRMGFECINRPGVRDAGYQRINLIDCTFDPQGSEAISYDDDSAGAAGNCVLQGNVVKGAGINPAFPWGQALEIGGPRHMIVTGNTFSAGRGDVWNLRMPVASDCGWVFSDNVIDATAMLQPVPMDPEANCIVMIGVHGGVFSGNVITSASPGGGVAWMDDCHGMDWRTSTWLDARGQEYCTPLQVGCSDNLF